MGLTRSVIVYLARSSEEDARDLCRSLTLLKKNFLRRFRYPVVVFVERSFQERWKKEARRKSGVKCHFETVEFRIPDFLDPRAIPEYVLHPKFKVGYRHMCRFFAGKIYEELALKNYRWYWRFDTDSFLLGKVKYDVFKFMEKNQYLYGYSAQNNDEPAVSVGLWDLTLRYMEDRKILPTFIHDFATGGEWDRTYYYTNFEISSLDFWRSRPVKDYFDHIDRSGGIYQFRWGDAPIHTLTIAMFMKKEQTHRFTDIYYDHQGPFNEPKPRIDHVRNFLLEMIQKINVALSTWLKVFRKISAGIWRVLNQLKEPRIFVRKTLNKLHHLFSELKHPRYFALKIVHKICLLFSED